MTREPPHYLEANLHRALAVDPRTTEQGVQVSVHGSTVYLSGEVTTAQRRDALSEVAAEVAPDMEIHNNVQLVPSGRPSAPEEVE